MYNSFIENNSWFDLGKWKSRELGWQAYFVPDSVFTLDILESMNMLTEYIEIVNKPLHMWRLHKTQLRQSYRNHKKRIFYEYSNYYICCIENMIADYPRLKISIELAKATLALNWYNIVYNKYPKNLFELVDEGILAEVPYDFCNNIPMTYKLTDDGYKVYSLWWDGVDDNAEKQGYSLFAGGGDYSRFNKDSKTEKPQTLPQSLPQTLPDGK